MAVGDNPTNKPGINWSIDPPPSLDSVDATDETAVRSHIQGLEAQRFGFAHTEPDLLEGEEMEGRGG